MNTTTSAWADPTARGTWAERRIVTRQRDTAAVLDIDIDLLRSAIAAGFGLEVSRSVELQNINVTPLPSTGGGSFNTTVQRVSNTTGPMPWSVVVKRLATDLGREGWDREFHVYTDEAWLTSALPDDLVAPELLASARTSDSVTLILEDLPATGAMSSVELATAARLLSEFNGADSEARPWWSADFLHDEFDGLSDHPERLVATRSDAKHELLRRQLVELMGRAPELLGLVTSLPLGPAHLDAYSRNIAVNRGSGTIGLIDWANAGSAPLGTDPATLFVLTLDYLDADASELTDLEASVIESMHAGLLDAGAAAAIEPATTAFHAVSRLRHLAMMMNALPMVEAADPAVSAIVGQPLEAIVDQWIAIGDHLLRT